MKENWEKKSNWMRKKDDKMEKSYNEILQKKKHKWKRKWLHIKYRWERQKDRKDKTEIVGIS